MAQVTGITNYWNSPQYEGMLWTADLEPGRGTGTPFVSLLGGLNGERARVVPDFDFAMSAEYDYPAASQPDIAESDAETAPSAVSPVLSQARNTVQIVHESVNITYKKLSTMTRIATDIVEGGVGYWAKEQDALNDAIAERKAYVLRKIARDMNYSFLNGTYQQSTDTDTSAKMRGVVEGVSTSAIDAAGAELTESMLQNLFATVAEESSNQAFQQFPILFVPAIQKQNISKIFGNQPESWNIGGLNVQTIMTDFGEVGVVYEPMINTTSTDNIALVALGVCRPVYNMVTTDQGNAGFLLYEDLAKTGAAMKGQFIGHLGIDYANEKMHGKITGLLRSRI